MGTNHPLKRRYRHRSKGRNWIPAAVAAGLMTIGSAPIAINILAKHGVDVPGAASVQSIMALLDQRSPGERTKGELTKTKRKHKVLSSSWPAIARTIQPVKSAAVEESPFLPPEAPPEFQMASFTPGSISPPVSFGGGPGGNGGGGGCCGTGGGGGGTTPSDNPEKPPVPAVPEPSTWAMLIIGFGAIGSALRRRRREQTFASVA